MLKIDNFKVFWVNKAIQAHKGLQHIEIKNRKLKKNKKQLSRNV